MSKKSVNVEESISELYEEGDDALEKSIVDTASWCREKAEMIEKECDALWDEIYDFVVEGGYDMNDGANRDPFDLTLKDGKRIWFNTNTAHFFEDGDQIVFVMDSDVEHPERHRYRGSDEYRDDFVEDHTRAMWDDIQSIHREHDFDAFDDELNDAGDLYYITMVKTALTVAKEHMAKWDGIDHTVDDDEAVAE